MKKMTEQNLRQAFTSESQTHMRYLVYSEVAEKEGKKNIARLFRAIAFAEQVHARNHLSALDDIGKTVENLETAIEGENFEIEEMYPAYDMVAKLQGELNSIQSIHYAIEAEKPHAALFMDAKRAAEKGKDMGIREIFICPNCGYTQQDDVDDTCPSCGNSKTNFIKF